MNHTVPAREEAPGLLGASSGLLGALVRGLDWSAQLICVGSLAILFIGLFANVVLRYFFGSGLDWAYDIHTILFPWMIAAGAVLATIHGRHIAITLLRDHSSRALGRFLYLLTCAMVVVISLVVIWSTYPIMLAARFQRIAALGGISHLWGYLSITYAFAAIAMLSVIDAITTIAGHRDVRADGIQNSLS